MKKVLLLILASVLIVGCIEMVFSLDKIVY
jgi:hypothetical protein